MLASARHIAWSARYCSLTAGVIATLALSACGGGSAKTGTAAAPAPASAAATDPHTANVTVTSDRCVSDRSSYDAGGLTVNITNKNANAVNEIELLAGERIIGEKEGLPPGFSGNFTIKVDPGTYTLYCPGATTERVPFVVGGTVVSTAAGSTHGLLMAGTKTYGAYVSTQAGLLHDGVVVLAAALAKPASPQNLAAAQAAYDKSRVYYERIEPVAESFNVGTNNLDSDIDERADDVAISQVTGFHRIEYGLFTAKSLAGLAPVGAKLVADVAKLQGLTKNLTYQPAELANGAVDLLDEVQKSKITGEEERYAHIDILDFQGNVEGAEQAFANLQPGLQQIDPTLTATVTERFAALDTLLDTYRVPTNPSGFGYFSSLTTADKQKLSQAVQAVSEPLSRVAGKVVNS